MNLSKKIVSMTLLALMSIFSVLTTPGLSSLVICLGSDGHLEVEYSVNGKCGTTTKATQATAVQDTEAESHCGTCTDVSFIALEENTARGVHGADAPQSPTLVDFSVQENSYLDRATVGLISLPPPLGSQHLAHLRTIRLLV